MLTLWFWFYSMASGSRSQLISSSTKREAAALALLLPQNYISQQLILTAICQFVCKLNSGDVTCSLVSVGVVAMLLSFFFFASNRRHSQVSSSSVSTLHAKLS